MVMSSILYMAWLGIYNQLEETDVQEPSPGRVQQRPAMQRRTETDSMAGVWGTARNSMFTTSRNQYFPSPSSIEACWGQCRGVCDQQGGRLRNF